MQDQSSQFGDLFQLLGLEGLSQEEKEKYLQQWNGLVQDRITLRIMSTLSEDDQKKLDELPEGNLDAFLREKIPQLDNLVLEESLKFREGLIADANFLKGAISAQQEKKDSTLG